MHCTDTHDLCEQIVQEIARSNSATIMLCGKTLFHFWELGALADDVLNIQVSGSADHLQDLEIRSPSWYLWWLLESQENDQDASIWEHVSTYYASYCSDPRDRVFALLDISDSASRQAIRPDYTLSVTSLVLRLLGFKAKLDKQKDASTRAYFIVPYEYNFRDIHNVIGACGLGPRDPDVAVMLKKRLDADCNDVPTDVSPSHLPQRPWSFESGHLCRIVLDVKSHCKIWKNEAGEYIAPLSTRSTVRIEARRKGHFHQSSRADDATPLRNLNGTVVGLVPNHVQSEDTLLFFHDGNARMFHCGLIVRQSKHDTHSSAVGMIVGQCIFSTDIEVCRGGQSCVCLRRHPSPHIPQNLRWQVHMAPEDLLVFIAQDLKLEHRTPKKFEVPMADVAVRWEESEKRLGTRVTCGPFSSYAVLEDLGDGVHEMGSDSI